MKEITLEVKCFGCLQPVLPTEISWALFRQTGIPCHNRVRCFNRLDERLYGEKKEVRTRKRRNLVKNTP